MTRKKAESKSTTSTTRGGTRPRTTTKSKPSTTAAPSRSKARPSRPRFNINVKQKAIIIGVVMMLAGAILGLSLLSFNKGKLMTDLSDMVFLLFGWGGVLVPFVLMITGFYLVSWGMDDMLTLPRGRVVGAGLLFLTFEVFATLWKFTRGGYADVLAVADARTGGGVLGALVVKLLAGLLGNVGVVFVFLVIGVFGTILFFGLTRADLSQFIQGMRESRTVAPELPIQRELPLNRPLRGEPTRALLPPSRPVPLPEREAPPAAEPTPAETPAQPKSEAGRSRRKAEPAPAAPMTPATPATAAPIAPITLGKPNAQSWTLPTLVDMLESGGDQDISDATIREQVEVIEHTLDSFGAPATVVEINQGPTITQYGVEPNFVEMRNGKRTKVKVGKIASLADDLALALAARSIRIQAPVPGKGYVGIEVPNPSKALVSLRDVMEAAEFRKIKSPLAIGLGQNVAGQPIATDLSAMPHLLIAGTTGSGKSVCVNGIIACLLLQNSPDDLKLVMVDPKRVELTGYNGIPHLVAPVVVDLERVVGTLQWAMREMDGRYQRFSEVAARNIIDYNSKMLAKGEQKLPYIVIIIDELADLMMLSPEDTERGITRLAQMARATGIHMVIATQRPSVDVVTGLIKANFPARIAFAVASSTDSRVILDTVGAERLLGQGDMLFQSPDAAAPVRMQGCFVSDKELSRLIEYWRGARRFNVIRPVTNDGREGTPTRPGGSPGNSGEVAAARPRAGTPGNVPSSGRGQELKEEEAVQPVEVQAVPEPIIQPPLWEELRDAEQQGKYEDELMPEAIELVKKLGKASTSLLQRRFRIGYTRAARLIDLMEEDGIIGPPTGTSKAREVVGAQNGTAGEDEAEDGETAGAEEDTGGAEEDTEKLEEL
jgi:S-DNA-T family DNA segregation ATPase FtsK/SpoIIIE